MARVKSFRIHPIQGVPDRDIQEFLNECEQDMFIHVTTAIIPKNEEKGIDHRITVIVTKIDDLPINAGINRNFGMKMGEDQ